MGRETERVLLLRGHDIVARIDPVGGEADQIQASHAESADVAIEFSLPDGVLDNAGRYAQFGLNAVVGTTGWYDRLDEVRAMVDKAGIGYLYGPNFSIGVHLFYRIVAAATRLVDLVEDYDVMALEMHHNKKKDSPSGTARALAQVILDNASRKDRVVTDRLDRAIEPGELHMASVRGGAIPGVHRVVFDSAADTIEVSHTARNRSGFALGTVLAAEWLNGKSGFFSVDDFVNETLH